MNETELLASWRPWLRVTAARMTTNDPESCAAEGWVAIWRALPSYDGRAPFDPWCKAVARNRMRNVIRDSHAACRDVRREARVPDVLELVDVGAEVHGLEMAYHHGEVAAAIGRLTPQQRQYVMARFWGGETYTELAARFDTNPSGIWKWARRRLAVELAHLGATT